LHKREHFKFRTVISAKGRDELIEKLKNPLIVRKGNTQNRNKLIFMFPGQGSQYGGMSHALYENESEYKKILDECIGIANEYLEIDLKEILTSKNDSRIHETQWAQIALFVTSYALAKYLESIGVIANGYLGHSIGEFVAAALSDVFTVREGIQLVIARGRLMQSMQRGSMLSIRGDMSHIEPLIESHECEVSVINSPKDIVASGTQKNIEALKGKLDSNEIFSVILQTSHAFHSESMEEASAQFKDAFENVVLKNPKKKFLSNLTGKWADESVTKPDYWCRQLRNPVQFSQCINTLYAEFGSNLTFIEVGAGKGLGSFVHAYQNEKKSSSEHSSLQTIQLMPSSREFEEGRFNEIGCKKDLLANLWQYGFEHWKKDFKWSEHSKIVYDLPVYQFDSQVCWLKANKAKASTGELSLLPESKWLSTKLWKQCMILDEEETNKPTLKKVFVFERPEYDSSFNLECLGDEVVLRVVLDVNAQNLEKTSDNTIKINPTSEESYKKLLEYIQDSNLEIETILHTASWSYSDNNALEYGFYSIFLIREYLLNDLSPSYFVVLTKGISQISGDDRISALNGAIVGAMRNIMHELLQTQSMVVDIDRLDSNLNSQIAQMFKKREEVFLENIFSLRRNILWIEEIDGVDVPENKANIKEGDTILITGGIGGVGLSIAREISLHHSVNFILISRNKIDESTDYGALKIEILSEIKKNGSSIDLRYLDISDKQKVKNLIESLDTGSIQVNGLIHAAGVLKESSLSFEKVKDAFKGKVIGFENILQFISHHPIRYIASTSSLASIFGDVNRIEYCAANSYLDTASKSNDFIKAKRIAINWPGW
jgi:malonyl CoA-acyl carrier protein transacylase